MKFDKNYQFKWDFKNLSYGTDEKQKLDIYIPKKEKTHAIIYIHGGAYFSGNKMQYPSFLANYSDNVIASIDYRVINENNNIHMGDMLSDINDAINRIVEFSFDKGVNICDLILIGHSAGGHLSLLYGYKFPIRIAACISLAGPTDFTDDTGWSSMPMWGETIETRLAFMSWMGSRLTRYNIELKQNDWTKQKNYFSFEKHVKYISPIMYVSEYNRIPATLLVHARGDDQVPYSNAVRLYEVLKKLSFEHKLITTFGYADSHMLGGEVYSDDSPFFFKEQEWVKEAQNWLEKYLE